MFHTLLHNIYLGTRTKHEAAHTHKHTHIYNVRSHKLCITVVKRVRGAAMVFLLQLQAI